MASRIRFAPLLVVPAMSVVLAASCTSFKASEGDIDASSSETGSPGNDSGLDGFAPVHDGAGGGGTFVCPAGAVECDDYERSEPSFMSWSATTDTGSSLAIDGDQAFTGARSLRAAVTATHTGGQAAYLERGIELRQPAFRAQFAMRFSSLPSGRINAIAFDFTRAGYPKRTLVVALDAQQGLVLSVFTPNADAGMDDHTQAPAPTPEWHAYALQVSPALIELTVDGSTRLNLPLSALDGFVASSVRVGLAFADPQPAGYAINLDSVVVPK